MKNLKAIQVRDTESMFERDTKSAIDAINKVPILQGNLIKELEFAADFGGAVKVYHKLGRPATGWFVVKSSIPVMATLTGNNTAEYAELTFYILGYESSLPPILVTPGTTTTADIWIF